jgi:hypothetical protein
MRDTDAHTDDYSVRVPVADEMDLAARNIYDSLACLRYSTTAV